MCPSGHGGGVLKDVVEWNLVDWSSVSVADTSAVADGAMGARPV